MWTFGRDCTDRTARHRVARALVRGATIQEVLNEAVEAVLVETGADRAAVWLETSETTLESAMRFRGMVVDRNREVMPAEWKCLSVEAVPANELLRRGKTVENEGGATSAELTIGALLDIRRAAWIPIQTRGNLRGVLFAGMRHHQVALNKTALEGIAAEVALAIQLEDERCLARQRQEDLKSARHMLAAMADPESAELVLRGVVEDCTKKSSVQSGPEAVFAVVGELQASVKDRSDNRVGDFLSLPTPPLGNEDIQFSWRSGEQAWIGSAEREPALSVWRQALQSGRVTGSEPSSEGPAELARVVALPLEAEGQRLGVLVTGLRHGNTSLATLERLEFRAIFAAQALLRRKRRREEAHRQEWQEALLGAAGSGVAFLDAGGKIVRLNRMASELLREQKGIDPANRAGGQELPHFAQIFRPRERARMESWLNQASDGRSEAKPVSEPLESELANGQLVRVRAVRALEGGVTAVALESSEANDATQQHQRERAETELRNVVEWLEEGMVLFDARQEIRLMNSRFAQMVGFTPEEATEAWTLRKLIERLADQTEEPENFAGHWLGVAQGTQSGVRDEVRLLRPAPRVLERASRPVLDLHGGRLGRVEIYRDLTAQRVFHSRLVQTEKLAALGQMLTSIAHELSNPLTSILGYAQRLVRREGTGESGEARQIFQEAERASTILKQLLLTARNSRPERRKIPLNEVVSRTVELQKSNLNAQNVHIELQLDPMLPLVLGDDGQLQQVLMNLIGNARQAIEQAGKGGTIWIRTKRAGGTHAVLEVCDDGPGIPQSILSRIFDPFFTTKPAGMGTGLGLSVVVGIVREHGGQIRVTSPAQGGATFSIELPAVPGALTPFPLQQPSAGAEEEVLPDEISAEEPHTEATLAPWAGSLVLVVEDEATVAQLIADVLKDEGLNVDVLLDGREALRRAANEAYDLIVCDLKMPDLDGETFYEILSRTDSLLRRRMLFVTGDVLATHTCRFLKRDELPYLAKPFRVEELTEKVRQIFAGTRPRPEIEKSKVARN